MFDYRTADLNEQDRVLCDYAAKLTLTPGDMNESDVEKLRAAGYSDEQISISAQVIGYFNYINRIADGLGVDLEPWMTMSEEQWRRQKGKNYLT